MAIDKEDEGKQINAGVSITVQLQQYEPLKLSVGSTIPGDPENTEDWAKLWDALYTQLFEQLDESEQVKKALKGER